MVWRFKEQQISGRELLPNNSRVINLWRFVRPQADASSMETTSLSRSIHGIRHSLQTVGIL